MTYCCKCKAKTPDAGKSIVVKTRNGRMMMKSKCARCGTTKCSFVKSSSKGDGIIQDIAGLLC